MINARGQEDTEKIKFWIKGTVQVQIHGKHFAFPPGRANERAHAGIRRAPFERKPPKALDAFLPGVLAPLTAIFIFWGRKLMVAGREG